MALFTNAQVVQIRRLIKAERVEEESWLRRHAFSIFLVILASTFGGVLLKRIGNHETDLTNKTVGIGFEVALTIVENNPELLGDDKALAGLLHIAERDIQQAFDEDISERLGNLLSTTAITSEDLVLEGDKSLRNRQNLRALTLYKLSHEVFKREHHSPGVVASKMMLTILRLSIMIRPFVETGGASRERVNKYATEYTVRLLKELHSLKNVTPSVKAFVIGGGSNYLVSNMLRTGDIEKAVQLAEEAIAIMENEFRENASRYRFYGSLLNNQGVGYERKGQGEEALASYATAFDAILMAADYKSDEDKIGDLVITRNNFGQLQCLLNMLDYVMKKGKELANEILEQTSKPSYSLE